ncbi:hypothetical protein BC941DRAFT_347068 [Chlamydoabsidia padenii]|nr:hypothetical protein BC941DRAFT_347068 [Chlamydoabsidia padenii]
MYTSPSFRMEMAKQLNWYLASDVLKYVYQLRNYVLQTPGKLSQVYLPTLKPYDKTKLFLDRFPSDQHFICEGIGDWNDMIQRIQLLTSIITNTNRALRGYQGINTRGEAETALLGGIDDIIQAYESAQSFIDQETFEERYELTWEIPSPRPNNSSH